MADDLKVVISVDDTEVLRGVDRVNKLERGYKRLDAAFNKGKITAQQYARGVQQVDAAIKNMDTSLKQATASQQRFENTSRKGMRRVEILAQQAGYQIGDLAVQIQSGTNAAVALGQQGSQLLGFFGPAGAIAGAGLAIATGLIAPFLKAKDAAKEAREEAEALAKFLEGIRQDIDILRTGARNVEELKAIQKLEQAQKDYNDAIATTVSLSVAAAAPRKIAAKPQALSAEEKAKKALDEAKEDLKEIRDLLNEREEITSRIERIEKANARSISAGKKAYEEMISSQKEIVDTANKIKDSVEERVFKLQQENKLLIVAKAFGKDSADYKSVENYLSGEALKRELEKQGILGDNLKTIMNLVYQQKRLNDELAEEEEKRKRIAKIAFSSLSTEDAMTALAYQAYGQSRLQGARTKPSTAPTSTKGKTPSTIEDNIKAMEREMEAERKLIGLEGERRRAQELYQELLYANQDADIKTTETRLRNLANQKAAQEEYIRKLDEEKQRQEDLANSIGSSFETALMSIVDGTKSVEDAFRTMATEVIKELYRVLVVQKMVNAAKMAFGFADGGVIHNGSVVPYANGGVVGSPTYFPMSGGRTGLMGEAGPEAIMPLKRGKNGKLGVSVEGQSDAVVVNNYFNFAANGDDSVKRIIVQSMPQITEAAKSGVLDARKRGGSFRKVFS